MRRPSSHLIYAFMALKWSASFRHEHVSYISFILNNYPLEKECRSNLRYKSIFCWGCIEMCLWYYCHREKFSHSKNSIWKLWFPSVFAWSLLLHTASATKKVGFAISRKRRLKQFATAVVVVQSFGKLLCSSSVDEIKSFLKPCVHFLWHMCVL